MLEAYKKNAENILTILKTNINTGLTNTQVIENRKDYGENSFKKEEKVSLLRRILEAAKEPMIIMLILAGIITLIVEFIKHISGQKADLLEGAGIFAAILLSIIITVIMEGRSAKAFEELNKINEDTLVKVKRDNKIITIPQKEVVVGDIVFVTTGDKLAADGRLIESSSLHTDESSLTGESNPVSKNANIYFTDEDIPVAERLNMLYCGSFVTGGNGIMVVTETGENTEFGKIAKELSSTKKTATPLQEKMAKLGKQIAILGSTAAAIVFIVQVIIFIKNNNATLDTVSEAFITSIVLIVAAVPEGLSTIVAVSLSINIIKMSKQNALVRKLVACETIGSINVICSDKTGTLTENRMTVIDIFADNKLVKPQDLNNQLILENFCINSTADIGFDSEQIKFIGNPTESALLVAASKAGKDYREIRESANIIYTYPFSSEEKSMTTITEENGNYVAYTKGSPEKIIEMCNIPEDEKKNIELEIINFEEKAFRIIGFSHKHIDKPDNFENRHKEIKSNMIFDGFVTIKDPLRQDVFEAINKCKDAGINVKMLTGDNLITAKAIANDLHLINKDDLAVEAKELEKISDQQLIEKLSTIKVIARSTPVIKMRVVNALKASGNIVAVTGDGINDAPALKNADVGIAMGITGTEVSKAASDIVLLDDSFSTIVKAVKWGRGIYENFQRLIQFQLTVNLSSIITILSSILLGFAAPFTALQILWINIVMDGPPALTLGLEPIKDDLMKRHPIKRSSSIVSSNMLVRIAVNGIFITAAVMCQRIFNFLMCTQEQMPSVLFTLFVLFQLFNAFNCRELSSKSIFINFIQNRLMLAVFFLTFCLQIIITQFGGIFYDTVSLPLSIWLKIILTAFSIIIFSEIIKFIERNIVNKNK